MTDDTLSGRKVWVAGHAGMVGAALVRRLQNENCEILTVGRAELDLRRQAEVEAWITLHRPDSVFLLAATVGGIHANSTRPAEFLYDNLAIEQNIIHASYRAGVGKLLFLGSSCIYPRLADQPASEEALLTGPFEPTNEWYAIAKVAGLKLCQAYRRQYGCDFICAVPNNLYGPGDNFDPVQGHVAASLITKFHRAKMEGSPVVELWGTGSPLREFMFVDDVTDAMVFLMRGYSDEAFVNIASGLEISIRRLAELTARIVGYDGKIVWDSTKPDGMPRKMLKIDRLAELGWNATTSLEEGFQRTYQWYVRQGDQVRG
jgi:GDP-L-fucose synthase